MPTDALTIDLGYQLYNRAIIRVRGQVQSEDRDTWLVIDVKVYAGGFEGAISDYASIGHLSSFANQLENLYQKLQGKAIFGTIDGKFSVELQGDGKGHIKAQFDVMDDIARLKFDAELDQTFLPELIKQVRAISTAFSTQP
jgi:hypothetical protein